ncbi:MAG: Mur ligase family protein, partial [Oscillospiraceae bacterium]
MSSPTGREAITYLCNHSWNASRLGLERTRELLQRVGNPHKNLRFVHIAGTNGKGSTAAITASILRAAGYRTGLYTSPYIHTFHERMQIDGVPIADDELMRLTELIRPHAEEMKDHPTEFELITALAFLYFLHGRCDIVVLEVGLGGRLDSTNVVEAPEVSVITAIGLDHTAELGNTLEEIAGEKSGIIK